MKKSEPFIPAERKAAYISADAQGFTVLGTPEELANLLAKQIGDSLAQRIAAEVSLSVDKRIDKALREQTSTLSNCGWTPYYGKWASKDEDPKF